jgi:hypothetical protein
MIKLEDLTHCFYVPGQTNIVDMAIQNEAGEWVSLYSKQNLMQLRDERPEIVLGEFDAWFDQNEKSLISPAKEITRAEWWEALECLPPESWQHAGGGESFVMMEYYSGRITSIYVRLSERYFTFRDVANLPHLDRLAKARLALDPH